MAGVSLYLTNANITVTERMDAGKGSSNVKDFECVELGDLENKDQSNEKMPRRVIHFSSGETMEEYSTDEEDDSEKHPEKKDLLSSVDTSKLTWGPFVWFHMWRAATSTVSACDYLGERMASLFGLTSAKYQYAIDEHDRINKEMEKEVAESQLSGEAENRFEEQQSEEKPKLNQPEAASNPDTTEASSVPSRVNVHGSFVVKSDVCDLIAKFSVREYRMMSPKKEL
ncbi:protein FAM177A1 isoform X2 [Hoplias malabaricus]|uniref:protein FAM177A1 isoform X2 n=1 Tax=Hoplias malabaricus TaxID=27720 RepID=UPI003462407B